MITAAGEGRRFRKVGIERPKPVISVHGEPLLLHTLRCFSLCAGDTCLISGQANHGLREALEPALRQEWPQVEFHWIALNGLLPGQLATASTSLEQWLASTTADSSVLPQPFLIHNCDTGFHWHPSCLPEGVDACMPVFEAEGDHWSFGVPHPSDPSRAIAIAEKQRISNLASIGLYGFRSLELFRQQAARQLQQAKPIAGEHYIAPLLHTMLSQGCSVSLPRVEGVELYGTPAELCNTFGISLDALQAENR